MGRVDGSRGLALTLLLWVGALGCAEGSPARLAAVGGTVADGAVRVRYGSLPDIMARPATLDAASSVPLAAQDTLVVLADDPPVWGDDARLVEELRIGGLMGHERHTFGHVSGLATTSSGDVWVTDNGLKTVRRYSRDGIHLGDVGREGRGPGELRYPLDLRRLSTGEMALWDPLNQRIHRFDENGEFLGDIRVPVRGATAGRDLETLELDAAGRLYVRDLEPSTPTSPAKAFWLRLSPDRMTIDTLQVPPSDREGFYHVIRTRSVVSPHGYVVMGRNDEYALHRPLSDGRILRIERSFEPVRYARAEAAQAQELENTFAERWGERPRRMPDTKPVWSSFIVDADGRLWVARYVPGVEVPETEAEREARVRFDNPARTWTQPLVFDVLDPRGSYLGTLEVPHSATASTVSTPELMFARDRTAWMLEKGEYGEHYVVRYRLRTGS